MPNTAAKIAAKMSERKAVHIFGYIEIHGQYSSQRSLQPCGSSLIQQQPMIGAW